MLCSDALTGILEFAQEELGFDGLVEALECKVVKENDLQLSVRSAVANTCGLACCGMNKFERLVEMTGGDIWQGSPGTGYQATGLSVGQSAIILDVHTD